LFFYRKLKTTQKVIQDLSTRLDDQEKTITQFSKAVESIQKIDKLERNVTQITYHIEQINNGMTSFATKLNSIGSISHPQPISSPQPIQSPQPHPNKERLSSANLKPILKDSREATSPSRKSSTSKSVQFATAAPTIPTPSTFVEITELTDQDEVSVGQVSKQNESGGDLNESEEIEATDSQLDSELADELQELVVKEDLKKTSL
jgi:hypothetical protein